MCTHTTGDNLAGKQWIPLWLGAVALSAVHGIHFMLPVWICSFALETARCNGNTGFHPFDFSEHIHLASEWEASCTLKNIRALIEQGRREKKREWQFLHQVTVEQVDFGQSRGETASRSN